MILAVGLLIFGYNLMNGKNLFAKRQNFDFSQYLDTKDFNPFFQRKVMELAETINAQAHPAAEQAAAADEPAPGVYFTQFFKKTTPAETEKYIRDFLSDFAEIGEKRIIDLYASDCFDLNINPEHRSETLEHLAAEADLTQLAVIEPPVWQACYSGSYYPDQIITKIASLDLNLMIDQSPGDYVARLDGELSSETEAKITEMYGDVIKIKK